MKSMRDEQGRRLLPHADVERQSEQQVRQEEPIVGQLRTLEAPAFGKELMEILDVTIQMIEKFLPGARASVLLANADATRLFCASGKSLPVEYNETIDGIAIGEGIGSCGTAAFRRAPVIVTDIARDPLWQEFRELAATHQLGACWSYPIFSPDGSLLGTFAIYFPVSRTPTSDETTMLQSAARVAEIAIHRKQVEGALRESEERFAKAFRSSPHPIGITEVATGRCIEVNDACLQLFGFRREEVIGSTTLTLGIWPDHEERARLIERLKAGEPIRNLELSFKTKSGDLRHILVSSDLAELNGILCLITVGNDITKRKWAEEALRESEARFRTMAEAVPSVLFEADATGWNTWTSEDWCRFTGQTPEQVAGHGWAEALHPEDRAGNFDQWLYCIENGVPFESQHRLRRSNGTYAWVIARALPVWDDKGTIRRWVGSVTDVDAIVRAEEEQARLAAIVETSEDAIIGGDVQGMITSWNKGADTLLGYTAAEVIGRPVALLFPPDRLGQEIDMLDRLRRGESIRQYETVRRHKDGRDIVVSTTISPIRDKQGRILGASTILRDITERKRVEEALRESELRFRSVFEHAGTGIAIAKLYGGSVQCNPAYCAMLGYTEDELRQVDFAQLVHPADRDANQAEIKRLLLEELPYFEIENRYLHKSGDPIWVHKVVSLIKDHERRPKFLVALVTDVTERRRAQHRLERWTVELEEAVNEKTAELVHSQARLRALAGELSLAEQRERKRLAGELHDHLQQLLVLGRLAIGQSKQSAGDSPGCETVLSRVDDILSEALTYSRTLVAELSPPVLRDHGLAAGFKWLGAYMKKHGQTVTVRVPEGKEVQLPEDQVILLFQSVRELLINSSKHAGTGQATVTMEQVDSDLRITVSDEGAGFDPAATAAGGPPSGGMSSKFGLFSIQERMLALGGKFDLHSAPGQGTTATITLPLE